MTQISSAVAEEKTKFADTTVLGLFLDNHDNPRFLNIRNYPTALKNALAFILFAEGIPIVYYGTEQVRACDRPPSVTGSPHTLRTGILRWKRSRKPRISLATVQQRLGCVPLHCDGNDAAQLARLQPASAICARGDLVGRHLLCLCPVSAAACAHHRAHVRFAHVLILPHQRPGGGRHNQHGQPAVAHHHISPVP